MPKEFILSIITSMSLLAGFSDINSTQLKELRSHNVPIIDIRTPQEWQQTGIIEGSHPIMFFDIYGQDHAKEWIEQLQKISPDKSKPIIIYCAHANRTKAVGRWLVDQMGYKYVYELAGGIEYGWRDLGEETVTYKAK